MSLVLTRNVGTTIIIGEGPNEVRVTVAHVKGGQVKLLVDAPKHIEVDREEIRERKIRNPRAA